MLRRVSLPSSGLYPVATTGAALGTFALVAELGGSGFLAAYLLGPRGRRGAPAATPGLMHGFHEATGWIAQIGLFVLLGLLVTPSRLPGPGLRADHRRASRWCSWRGRWR